MLADGAFTYLFAIDGLNNRGLVEASDGGTVALDFNVRSFESGRGTIEAIDTTSGVLSEVGISASAGAGQSSIDNAGQVLALEHGYVSLIGNIEPVDNSGTIKADEGRIDIEATATLNNTNDLNNHSGGVIEALNGGIVLVGVAGTVFNLSGGLLKADGGTMVFIAAGGISNNAGATMEADCGGHCAAVRRRKRLRSTMLARLN